MSFYHCPVQAYGVVGCFRFLEGYYLLLITKRQFQGRICSASPIVQDSCCIQFCAMRAQAGTDYRVCAQITKCTVLQIRPWSLSRTQRSRSSRCISVLDLCFASTPPVVVHMQHVCCSTRSTLRDVLTTVPSILAVG